jgi:hypothetical protein
MSKKTYDKPKLEQYVGIFLQKKQLQDELEVRFGTKYYNPITKITFNNTMKKLKSLGFEEFGSENYHLNIQNEYVDQRTGQSKLSNIRTTINGLYNIQKYCKTNTFDTTSIPSFITFMQKFHKSVGFERPRLRPIDYHEHEFRVNYKEERNLDSKHKLLNNILNSWADAKKTFRLIKRITFVHKNFPFKVDFSIIKSSTHIRGKSELIPVHTIQESNVFNNSEHFEIELEIINDKAYMLSELQVIKDVKKGVQLILSGLQNTNYPISYTEINSVLKEYLKLTKTKEDYDMIVVDNNYNLKKRKNRWNFVGPSPISLEMDNIVPLNSENSSIANINKPYTVTEKADGIRKLLFIAPNKKVYLIDINLNIEFTGIVCNNEDYINTIVDGEHVLHDKHGEYINYYLCFDIYWLNSEDVRIYPLHNISSLKYDKKIEDPKFRLFELEKVISNANFKLISKTDTIMNIQVKTFYTNWDDDETSTIFDKCNIILEQIKNGSFTYETDGLIFTPIDKSVGSDKLGEGVRNGTWKLNFKWKPPEFNTIDFLVVTKKNENGEEIIKNIYNEGNDMLQNEQIQYYKTLSLRVGFDEKKHGILNPCEDIIQDNVYQKNYGRNNYKPVPFYPTDPTPNYPIHLANILLKNKNGRKQMLTENGEEEIFDNTIIECRFEKDNKEHWQWIPIRVRYDKTSELKRGGKNYGNAYHVAQSVWRSINLPITEKIISTGEGVIENNLDDNVYYNRKSKETHTKSLRDFHNKYIKSKLIKSVSNKGDKLIDMSVGKAGDIQKWIDAGLSFVFGLDYSKDNIENRMDGACARYIKTKRKKRKMFDALFIHGDSSENIKQTIAAKTDKSKMIINAINGVGSKDRKLLGEGVYKKWGIVKDGFNIVSNQFSLHYFFKNNKSINEFVRNCSEMCAVGGHMVGTCYNGRKIFDKLKSKELNEQVVLMKEDKKIWSIKKLYQKEEMPNTTDCLGYEIEVYQESINKSFIEYLVNFDYLIILMENYGFSLLSLEEANEIGLPKSIGSFKSLYDTMKQEIKQKRLDVKKLGNAHDLDEYEKEISFLNNYFVFKKIRNVNTKNVFNIEMAKTEKDNIGNMMKSKETIKAIMEEKISKKVNKKFNKKFTLPNMGEEKISVA